MGPSDRGGTPLSFADWEQARLFWRKLRPAVPEEAIESRLVHALRKDNGSGRHREAETDRD